MYLLLRPQRKCEQYWAGAVGEVMTSQGLSVHTAVQDELADYTYRELSLHDSTHVRADVDCII